jgi:hypothetical protein
MNDKLLGHVAEVWRLAVDFMRDRREALRTMNEYGSLDRNEASRILAEAGLSAADFREVASRPYAYEDLMSKGMDSIGIDSDEFAVRNGDWFRSLEHNCALCRVRGRCRKVIQHSEFAERFHEFCPNSGDFDQILAADDVREPGSDRTAYIN